MKRTDDSHRERIGISGLQGRRLTKLQIIRTLLTIAGLVALIWLGVFQTNRANLLAAGHAPVSQPRDQLKQADKGGSTSDNQNDDVSKIVGIATLVVLLVQSWISGRQASLMRRQTDIYERQADIAEGQRQISDRQANIAQRQTEIMAGQRDISLATERAWVRVTVEVAGPIKITNGQIDGFFMLEFLNTGTLPANIDQHAISAHSWNMDQATSDEPRVTYMLNNYKTAPLTRHAVIFPQQSIRQPVQIALQRAGANVGKNMMMGFVPVLRGAIRYDYSGTDQAHYTTFHVHIVRRPDPAVPTAWLAIPTDDGTVVPADHLFVTNQLGKTEAT